MTWRAKTLHGQQLLSGHSKVRVVVASCLLLTAAGCGQQAGSAGESAAVTLPPPKIELGEIACLTTQWYPDNVHDNDETENRIARELVRQGVLMTLREELGKVTRDETLQESFPEPKDAKAATAKSNSGPERPAAPTDEPLSVWLDLESDGSWEARLFGAGSTRDNPVWKHEGKIEFDKATLYCQLAEQMADLSDTIAEKLREAGASGKEVETKPEDMPSIEIDQLLQQMNFVSQFAAVRIAHQAIREKGASEAWLGVLVRGYANLAMLTEHAWSSQTEAFAARAMLYAERLCKLSHNDASAQWHRAYAYAVIGAHAAAIEQLGQLEGDNATAAALPTWTELIAPLVEFDDERLEQLANSHPELKQTATLLQWQICRSNMHGRWIYERGQATAQVCPEAYGIYSVMANWNALGTQRTGSSLGLAAFGERLPARLLTLQDLPEEARKLGGPQNSWLARMLGVQRRGSMSDRPMKFRTALVAATEAEATPTECSWGILAALVAEEQFIQVANLMKVSGNAVEYAKDDLVERVMPLVEDHRYAAYIRSFAVPRNDPQRLAEVVQDMTVVDPRANMQRMFSCIWHLSTANGKSGNELAWRSIWARDLTQPGLIDMYYGMANDWTTAVTDDHRRGFAADFRRVSPHSPNATRLQWETNAELTAVQLKELERQLGDDPVGWMTIGYRYYAMKEYDSAERCFKRSVEISPCKDATVGLANTYYNNGKKELWQPTLESYLKVEDLGLAHAQIHQLIAEENIRNRQWAQAEPHAVAAADTYSASGLLLAGKVYEGLQDWTKSEYFEAEASRNYPSYFSGTAWYFWCRRNGRGDLEAARQTAEQSIQIAGRSTRFDDAYRVFVYRVLEGGKANALAGFDVQVSGCLDGEPAWDAMYRLLHVIALSSQIKDADRQKSAIEELRQHVDAQIKPTHPNWVELVDGMCRAFNGERLDDEYFKKFDEAMSSAGDIHRCNYSYFLGAALEQQGEYELADNLGIAAFGGQFDRYNATLAGFRLAERHGPERGGIPDEFKTLEEQSNEQEEPSAESASADAAAESDAANPIEPSTEPSKTEQTDATKK